MKKQEQPKENQLDIIRHSTSHILAAAILEIFPRAKLGIGPTIENGFYYDFDFNIGTSDAPNINKNNSRTSDVKKLTDSDLPEIEKRMRELIKKDLKFEKQIISLAEAKKLFKTQPYKLDLIQELMSGSRTSKGRPTAQKLTAYKSGEFTDLCKGPHVKSSKEINPDAFKLTKIAGAYWRGDEKNPMLTRIYGLSFNTQKELEDYLKLQEEAKKRDHRVIGKNLDLFVFSDLVGKGLPLFTERGSIIRRELEKFIVDEEIKRGYNHVYTPELAKTELYKTSGHYPYYKSEMYPVMKIDNEELILRPMTCPHHFQLYLSKPRTYKELPVRFAELAKQFRYEKSGELTGLMRVRLFCLADAHIICRKDQAVDEINNVLNLIEYIASTFGLKKGENYRYRLSLGSRQDTKKYYKDDKAWDFAENVLRQVLQKRKAPFFEAEKEAAFYGPKIDIQMKNFSGKEDTAFTVQYDFVMPKRFGLSYVDENGKKQEAVVIHRSSIGAIERVMAFLLEHFSGALPLWLSPVQAVILPIGEKQISYARNIFETLKKENVRVEMPEANETLGKRIRDAEMQKIPYILVVGDKEMGNGTINVRHYRRGQEGEIEIEKLIEKIKKEIENKTI